MAETQQVCPGLCVRVTERPRGYRAKPTFGPICRSGVPSRTQHILRCRITRGSYHGKVDMADLFTCLGVVISTYVPDSGDRALRHTELTRSRRVCFPAPNESRASTFLQKRFRFCLLRFRLGSGEHYCRCTSSPGTHRFRLPSPSWSFRVWMWVAKEPPRWFCRPHCSRASPPGRIRLRRMRPCGWDATIKEVHFRSFAQGRGFQESDGDLRPVS